MVENTIHLLYLTGCNEKLNDGVLMGGCVNNKTTKVMKEVKAG
jgi:hypothetical protein